MIDVLANILHLNKQIRTDVKLLKQLYDEEHKQFKKQTKQVEKKRSCKYHLNQMRNPKIPNHSIFVTRDREDPSVYFEIP